MAILANRVKIKSGSSELGKFVFFYLRKIFTTMLVFVCCMMLYFSHYFGLTTTLLDYIGKVMSLGNIIYGESGSFGTLSRFLREEFSFLSNIIPSFSFINSAI